MVEKQDDEIVITPQEYLGLEEDWLRAGRRRSLLLSIIYYLNSKVGAVSKDELERF